MRNKNFFKIINGNDNDKKAIDISGINEHGNWCDVMPEKVLFLAVLEKAVMDAIKSYDPTRMQKGYRSQDSYNNNPSHFKDGRTWIFSDSKKQGSFYWTAKQISHIPQELVIKTRRYLLKIEKNKNYEQELQKLRYKNGRLGHKQGS